MGWRATGLFGLRRPRRRLWPGRSLTRLAMVFRILGKGLRQSTKATRLLHSLIDGGANQYPCTCTVPLRLPEYPNRLI